METVLFLKIACWECACLDSIRSKLSQRDVQVWSTEESEFIKDSARLSRSALKESKLPELKDKLSCNDVWSFQLSSPSGGL